MALPDDIIVVVPKGTRVRYVESEWVQGVYVLDAKVIHRIAPASGEALTQMLFGLPVYDADEYEEQGRIDVVERPDLDA